jgi:hypothetical protein
MPVARRKRARRIRVAGRPVNRGSLRRAGGAPRTGPPRPPPIRSAIRCWPAMGIRTRKSQRSRVRRRMPLPSAPSTSASGPLQIGLVQALRRLAIGAGDPDAPLLELIEGPREIRHAGHGHELGRARGDLAHDAVNAGRPVARDDHDMHAGRVRGAQAGAEVVRIGDAVEHEQQRILRQAVERREQGMFVPGPSAAGRPPPPPGARRRRRGLPGHRSLLGCTRRPSASARPRRTCMRSSSRGAASQQLQHALGRALEHGAGPRAARRPSGAGPQPRPPRPPIADCRRRHDRRGRCAPAGRHARHPGARRAPCRCRSRYRRPAVRNRSAAA